MTSLELCSELKCSSLDLFEPIADLGYFAWKPNVLLGYKDLNQIVSSKEIQNQILVDNTAPPVLVNLKSLA